MMKQFASVEEYNRAIGEVPKPNAIISNQLYMNGPIFTKIYPQHSIPIYESSEQIEKIIREAYADCHVDGMQLAPHMNDEINDKTGMKTIDWRGCRLDYQGIVYAIFGGEVVAEVQLYLCRAKATSQTPLIFEAHLATGGYLKRTQDAVAGLWPLLEGFEFAVPNIPERFSQPKKYGAGAIVLYKDGKPAATGLPAIRVIGLDLPDKPVFFVESCYYL
jgi:hypothetical protein